VLCGLRWGKVGEWSVIDTHVVDDVAGHMDVLGVVMGKGDKMGARGVSRCGLGGVGRLLDCHWRFWGWLSCFVEEMTHSDKHICSSFCISIGGLLCIVYGLVSYL
jgi:hypothetical protein